MAQITSKDYQKENYTPICSYFCCIKRGDNDDDWESDDYIDNSVNVDWNTENWREQLENDKSSPNLCVHSSSSYVSPSMLSLSSGDLIEWSLVCHSTLSYQKFCDRHSNHYDHPEELHQSVE